jgi:hypothetical protein
MNVSQESPEATAMNPKARSGKTAVAENAMTKRVDDELRVRNEAAAPYAAPQTTAQEAVIA